MTQTSRLAAAAAAALGLGLGGWAGAAALQPAPAPASAGRVLQVRYEVRRAPAYAPPASTEAARLDVLSAAPAAQVDDGVLSARAGDAWRSLQADDQARSARALAAVRAADARIDREAAEALRGNTEQEGWARPGEAPDEESDGGQPAP